MNDFVLQVLSILTFMVFYNTLIHQVLMKKYHLAFAVTMSFLVVGYGIILDLDLAEMGFDYPLKGFVYGSVVALGLNLIIGALLSHKKTRSFFADSRVAGVSLRGLAVKTLIDIPLTTVLFEEVLFRGLILGLLMTQYDQWQAIAMSSVLFGLWHIYPALNFAKTNKKASGFPLATVLGTVIFTGVTGIIFGWLRVVSGSLIAPMLLHFASNSGSFLASWLSHRIWNR